MRKNVHSVNNGHQTTKLDDSNKWIVLLPSQETIKLKCPNQDEAKNLPPGSYIPIGCRLACTQHTIINENQFSQNQPILLLAMEVFGMEPYKPIISLQLEDMDELQSIKTAFRQNQPEISFLEVAHIPSFWTLSIYILISLYQQRSISCTPR
ncbi:hypothetical protein JTB14_000109 [Gonioctena quinquepunctata]|nr:hypothetical protein JTB14_000109 [Gonioctena quinquepunctata]